MNPFLTSVISGTILVVIGLVGKLIYEAARKSAFSDRQRKEIREIIQDLREKNVFCDRQREYIDARIIHKLNNYRVEANAKFVHKKVPMLDFEDHNGNEDTVGD